MYLIELNDTDLDSALSDAEYFTASEDEYFSAEESSSSSDLRYISPSFPEYSLPSAPERPFSYRSGHSHSSCSRSSRTSNSIHTPIKRSHRSQNSCPEVRWTVDDSVPRDKYRLNKHTPVDTASMKNYYLWRRLIVSGKHPRDAASIVGSKFNFKQVKQKRSIQLFSLRLSDEHRVYFMIQEEEHIVKVLNIGGHAFS